MGAALAQAAITIQLEIDTSTCHQLQQQANWPWGDEYEASIAVAVV